jgi:hypothetical protein
MRLARQDPAVPTGRKRSTRWEALTDWLARVRWGRLFVAVAVLLFLYTAVRR